MFNSPIFFSVNDTLNLIQPAYLALGLLIVIVLVSAVVMAILFHFRTYREYNPYLALAQTMFVIGLIALFILALLFLILYAI